jgi:hypothetical protein
VFDDRGRVYRRYCWLMEDMFARRRRPQPLTDPAAHSEHSEVLWTSHIFRIPSDTRRAAAP